MNADPWLDHQDVPFKAGPSAPHGGGSGFVKTRGGLAFLVTGRGTATVDSLSIDLVSVGSQVCPRPGQ